MLLRRLQLGPYPPEDFQLDAAAAGASEDRQQVGEKPGGLRVAALAPGEQRLQAGKGDAARARRGVIVAVGAALDRLDELLSPLRLSGGEVRKAGVQIDEWPEARREPALEGVGYPEPAS